jgi:hypothetical protein
MARRVFLHVGPPKTATSFLQEAWRQNQSGLQEQGLLYPGRDRRGHYHAAAVVCENPLHLKRMRPRHRGAWDRLTQQVAAFEGDALLSSERFAAASGEQADRALRRLEEVAAEVHLLVTARDLARQLPSGWQQYVKLGGEQSLEEWWRTLADERSARYWQSQDLASVLDRWTQHVPEDRAHLVVHARAGASNRLLLQRVCSVLDVDPALVQSPPWINSSLGASHVELLRRINAALPADRNRTAVGTFAKSFASQMIIPAHPSPPFVLPPEIHAWTVGRAKAMVDNLKRHQYDIVGDLDDLIPDDLAREGIAHDEVSDADLLDLAVPVLAKTLMQQKRLRDDIRSLRRTDRNRRSRQVRERGED